MTPSSPLRFAVLASDIVLFALKGGELVVRLIHVNRPPHFIDMAGLPGGLIDPKEEAEEAARRHTEIKAKVATKSLHMEQLYTFSRVDRDRRGRVVAVAYLALASWNKLSPAEREDSRDTWWSPLSRAKKLAYDHDEMLALALKRLRSRVRYTTLISKLMPPEFTLTDLEQAYESVLGTNLDKRNFRKKILKLGIVVPTARKRAGGRFRPAQLYRFASPKVEEIEIL